MRAHLSTLSLVLVAGLACDPAAGDADPRIAGCLQHRALPGDCDEDDGGDDDAEVCGYRTETQKTWGDDCDDEQTACLRDEYFAEVLPEGLYVGCGEFSADLLGSAAVEAALPTAGKPRGLFKSESVAYDGEDDPTVATSLFGEVVALSLNLEFDAVPAFHESSPAVPLGELVLAAPGTCAGMTVAQVLEEANMALAGCPAALTPVELDGCVAAINASFTGTDGKKPACSDLYEPTMP